MSITKNEQGLFEVSIQGKRFEFQKWGAEDATDTLLDLVAVVGESAGSLFAALTGSKAEMDVGSTSLDGLFRQLTLGITRDREMTKRLLKKLSGDRVLCNGSLVRWGDFYKDQLPLSFAVAKAQLEVQYGNFIDAIRSSGLLDLPAGVSNQPVG